jgi:hypothetical protein
MCRAAWIVAAGLVLWGCGEHARPTPSAPGITLRVPNPIAGRYAACPACPEPERNVVAEFAVVVGDPAGPGGTVATLEVRVFNRSRDTELARNTRPNTNVGLADAVIPAAGELQLQAGIALPPPPPRDEVVATVIVTLTDGRQTARTVPFVIQAAALDRAAAGVLPC